MTITPIDNYSDKDFSFKFSSPENDYSINFLDINEPNNGRLLREVNVTYKNTDITADIYDNWHYTDILEYDNFEFSSPDGNYLFFPLENNFIILNTRTKSKTVFQKNHSFGINYFDNKSLLIIGRNRLTIIDLVKLKSEEITADFPFDFAFFKETNLFFLSLQKGLFLYDKSKKYFELRDAILLPTTLFPNRYYKEFEIVSNDKNRGFTFALGVKTLNNSTKHYDINSWKIVSRTPDNKLIIATNVPEKTEKLADPYSYTYWFYGNTQYAILDY